MKVLDFGLVKSLDANAAQLTADGTLTGTPGYMPPERVIGGAVDARSDLYSLGCVAYWMLTGRTVFTGEPMAVMIHHARTRPEPPSKVCPLPIPERLEQIVMACLEKAPENRPASALELWRALGDVPVAAWTGERAESWWGEHLPDMARPSPGSDSSETILVPAP